VLPVSSAWIDQGTEWLQSSVDRMFFNLRLLEKGQTIPLGKVPLFLDLIFSCEQNKRPTLKFDVDADMCSIYRMIPRKFGFLGSVAVLRSTPISRSFEGLPVVFTGAYNIKAFFSWWHSLGMHCIALLVKFEDGLSISVLRNKATL
jgi:hypothetical protein